MLSLLASPVTVVLHTGHSVSLATYLARVLAHFLAVGGIAVIVFLCIRVIEAVHSAITARGAIDDSER